MFGVAFVVALQHVRTGRLGFAARVRAGLSVGASDRRAWLTVFLLCLPIYLLTAHYSDVSDDTKSAVLPAWQFVHHGNLWVEHMRPRPYWSVLSGDHFASNRMIGLQVVNIPMVALLYWMGPSVVPGALTAAAITAGTVAFMFLVFRRLAAPWLAYAATGVLAFGTSLWSVASTEVFPHTVDAFCLALVMYALVRERHLLAGMAFALAIPSRPHVAVIALMVGVGLAWSSRSWRWLLAIGIPAAASLALTVEANNLLFGQFSIAGGYAPYVENNLTSTSDGAAHMLLINIAGFLVSPKRGLFVFLPLAVVLLPGVRLAWSRSDAWIRVMALGGVAYSLVQLRVNRFDGGNRFYGYRLATELVICMAPLALVAARSWALEVPLRVRLMRSAAAASVGLQAIGVFGFTLAYTTASDPWRGSGILDGLAKRPVPTFVLLLATLAVSAWLLQKSPSGLPRLRRAVRSASSTWSRGTSTQPVSQT